MISMVLAGLILAGMGGPTKRVQDTYVAGSPDGSAIIVTTKVPRPATVAALREAFGTERVSALGLASPPPPGRARGQWAADLLGPVRRGQPGRGLPRRVRRATPTTVRR
ncbi:hypothetical protein [Polymorphospora lycopeni]|uniref:Uncharacterized protein n=1 Tax=Polymorphospora lycopeni TaxID=3140240 RepID=A0ABV5CU68_9ACTN